MKNIFYFLLLLIASCNQKQEIMEENYINKLSEGNYKVPSKYGGLMLFLLSEDGDIIVTNSDNLSYVYEKFYLSKSYSYKDFLRETLNNSKSIAKKEFDSIPFQSFKIDETVKQKYQKYSFNNFLKTYTLESNNFKESLKLNDENKNYQEIMTIAYYLYINGYQTSENDYTGNYSILKRDQIFEK